LSGWGLQIEQAKSKATFDQIWLSGNGSLKGALSLLTTSATAWSSASKIFPKPEGSG
jgi:hypothetical protein